MFPCFKRCSRTRESLPQAFARPSKSTPSGRGALYIILCHCRKLCTSHSCCSNKCCEYRRAISNKPNGCTTAISNHRREGHSKSAVVGQARKDRRRKTWEKLGSTSLGFLRKWVFQHTFKAAARHQSQPCWAAKSSHNTPGKTCSSTGLSFVVPRSVSIEGKARDHSELAQKQPKKEQHLAKLLYGSVWVEKKHLFEGHTR